MLRITRARIEHAQGLSGGRSTVYATFEDDREYRLLRYYPDELSFKASEFVGLTAAEAVKLHLEACLKAS